MHLETIREEGRDIPVYGEYDIVVCGGGPAGVAAAMASARMGRSVLLIESYGFLGGVNTAAGVNGIGGWQHDLDGRPLIAGIGREMMYRLAEQGGADPQEVEQVFLPVSGRPTYREGGLGCYWIRSNPDIVKIVLEDMLIEKGVKLLYHCQAVLPIMQDRIVQGVYLENKSGRYAVKAGIVIDCTGDGDLAARSGAAFQIGHPHSGHCQPMSLIFTVGNADIPPLKYDERTDERDVPILERNRYAEAIKLARNNREIVLNPNELFCAATPVNRDNRSIRSVNFTRVQCADATDADQLTQAEITGRKQVLESILFMRRYVKNCENAFLINILPQIGIRESRRITGSYVLTQDDVLNGARFPDSIARGIYLLDIHNLEGVGKSTLRLLDQPYDIPYRSLVPLQIDNLLVAGRCISGDHGALASYRIISHCLATGEAAGTAAALAIKNKQKPRDISIEILQQCLVNQGANIGEDL
jgi:hypothetical protein